MPHGVPALKDLAPRLLEWERTRRKSRASPAPAFAAVEKLRLPLIRLMGVEGFRSLFARARTLAVPEVPWLSTFQVDREGTLSGFEQLAQGLSAEERFRGEAALLAQLLGLLETFIGTTLTLSLLQEAWPHRDLSAFEPST